MDNNERAEAGLTRSREEREWRSMELNVEELSAVVVELTYLRLMQLPLGLLINFGVPSFREGVRRVANNYRDFAASRLRVNQIGAP
jgi:hypothetical protein